MNGGELTARLMAAAGITHAFGIMVEPLVPIVQEFHKRLGGRFIAVRHEQVGASAADAFARVSGRPAVCFGSVTAGATNLLTGVAIAYRDSVPLIIITGNDKRKYLYRDIWQGMDVVPIFRHLTKYSHQVLSAAEIPYHFRNAVLQATSGRPGPVHIDLPLEVAFESVDDSTLRDTADMEEYFQHHPARVPAERPLCNPDDIAAAVALLASAERPTIVVGGGAAWSDVTDLVVALAERLSAIVVVSSKARGAIPEDHPLCAGPVGLLGSPVANRALQDADVLLAIGCRLGDHVTRRWTLISPSTRIIQNHIEPEEIGRDFPVAVRLGGDASMALSALTAGLDAKDSSAHSAARSRAKRCQELRDAEWRAFVESNDSGLVKPQAVARELRAVLPRDAILTIGAGSHAEFVARIPAYEPRSQLKAIDSAAMSFAFAGALGAKLAAPQRDVVALLGDGDYMMTIQDLETAVRERIPVTAVVLNDFQFRAIKRVQGKFDESIVGTDVTNPNFGIVAEVFGGFGAQIRKLDELLPAFERARQANRERQVPAVLDVLIDPNERPRWQRMPYQEPTL